MALAGALADASRLYRRGLVLVDELAATGVTGPVDVMARTLARARVVRPLSRGRALSITSAKYAVCIAIGAISAGLAHEALGPLAASVAFVIAFYVVEVQLVFLLPIALDADAPPSRWWRAARASTVRAGGTWRAFWTVLPIALRMALGVLSTSPLRRWCAGCAAVVIWYEEICSRAREEVAK